MKLLLRLDKNYTKRRHRSSDHIGCLCATNSPRAIEAPLYRSALADIAECDYRDFRPTRSISENGPQEPVKVSDDFVQLDIIDGVAWLTLNDPARLNPVTIGRIQALNDMAAALSERDDAHVIVVTGAGRGFCSGADMADEELRSVDRYYPGSGSFLSWDGGWTLTSVRQPVIAAVNGAAIGFGMELALQADLRIAGASAKFGLPYAKMGGVSDTGAATWLMPRLIGHAHAAQLLFLGDIIDATSALRIGLVSQVVPDDQLHEYTAELAGRIASRVPSSVAALKRMLLAGMHQSPAEHILMQYEFMNRHRPDLAEFAKSLKGESEHRHDET